MKKQSYFAIILCVLIFSIIFHGVTNLISKEPVLTMHDIIHDILPYIIFLSIAFFIDHKYGNKEV